MATAKPKAKREVPSWVHPNDRKFWLNPHTVKFSRNHAKRFKLALWMHGYLSPNLTRKEAASGDGVPIPVRLRHNAQGHAFNLERLRFLLGSSSQFEIRDFYRSRAHNAAIRGVGGSFHMKALASDFHPETVRFFGVARFDRACETVFGNGGFGQYPDGSRHVDSRGQKARWTGQSNRP